MTRSCEWKRKRQDHETIQLGIAGVLFVLSIANLLRSREHEVSASGTKASAVRATLIAAPGRVEAVSEEIRVSSELTGRLRAGPGEGSHRGQRRQVLAAI